MRIGRSPAPITWRLPPATSRPASDNEMRLSPTKTPPKVDWPESVLPREWRAKPVEQSVIDAARARFDASQVKVIDRAKALSKTRIEK